MHREQSAAWRAGTSGFVLVGGKSSRMGGDKGLLPFGSTPLVSWIADRVRTACGNVTLVGSESKYSGLGYPVIEDTYHERGALAGIHAALLHSSAQYNLIVGCDMPYLSAEFLRWLVDSARRYDADVTVPESESFGYEPLCAVYAARSRSAVEDGLIRNERAIRDMLGRLRVQVIPVAEWKPFDPDGKLFRNLNTPEEYESACTDLLAGTGSFRK